FLATCNTARDFLTISGSDFTSSFTRIVSPSPHHD
ncbi:hypothetical protein NBJODN_NBJODN_04445, partial [Dysosmobacter welbionis]